MNLSYLIITMLTIYGVYAMYIPESGADLDILDSTTCVDCFDRRITQGDTYWDGCKFCTCDRTKPLEKRCQAKGCTWSPCPKIRTEIKDKVKSKAPTWSWPQK